MEDKIKMIVAGFVALALMQAVGVPMIIEQANSPSAHASPGVRPLLLFFGTVLDMRFYIPAGLFGGITYFACRSGALRRL